MRRRRTSRRSARRSARRGVTLAVGAGLLLGLCPSAHAARLFSLGNDRIPAASGIAALPDGSFLYSERYQPRVVRVYPDGRRVPVAGNGSPGVPVDGMPATAVRLSGPEKLVAMADGSVLIAESGYACSPCSRVLLVSPDGTISTIAGRPDIPSGTTYLERGDGGPATEAVLGRSWMEPLADGGLLIADLGQIRRVDPARTINTVAGTGIAGPYAGEGGPAVEAGLSGSADVASLPDGGFLITALNRVLRVDAAGTIRTIAGVGRAGADGDGGPAIEARLSSPQGIEPTADGGFVIADTGNGRIRRVTPAGHIETLAGGDVAPRGGPGCGDGSVVGYFNGDGIDARQAALCAPVDIVPDPLGGWLIAHSRGVSMLAGTRTARMGVAITRPQADRNRLGFFASAAGSATLQVKAGRRVIAAVTAQASPGINRIRLPKGPRGVHTLLLRAQNNAGSADDDRIRLLLGGRLPWRLGRALIENNERFQAARHVPHDRARAADGPYESVGRCRAFGARRVDCVARASGSDECHDVLYVRLAASGLLREGSYDCRPRQPLRQRLPRGAKTWPLPLL